jgi:hypothetical protein
LSNSLGGFKQRQYVRRRQLLQPHFPSKKFNNSHPGIIPRWTKVGNVPSLLMMRNETAAKC